MDGELEGRLAAAAEEAREYQLTAYRAAELRQRIDELERWLVSMRAQHAAEQQDVERLEGRSLTRVLASLRGAREDRLDRERAEAEAVRYRVREAEAILDSVRREYAAADARLRALAQAPNRYAAVLQEKERHLRESGDPRGQRLLALADWRGRLQAELRELGEALHAAGVARQALTQVQDRLGSADSWSDYDTFFGGGAIGSAVKHSRLDEAAAAAAHADRCLAVLRTELADLGGAGQTAPQLALDQLTRFVDIWFDNIFTDLAVQQRIAQAQHNVAHSAHLVSQVQARLTHRTAEVRGGLSQIDSERHALLTQN